jgi:hypothetical protein
VASGSCKMLWEALTVVDCHSARDMLRGVLLHGPCCVPLTRIMAGVWAAFTFGRLDAWQQARGCLLAASCLYMFCPEQV